MSKKKRRPKSGDSERIEPKGPKGIGPPASPPPIEPAPPQDDPGPAEIVRHILGPVDRPDAMRTNADEERRRLIALKYLIEQAAAAHGLQVSVPDQYAPELPQTARAAEIKALAEPQMAAAADRFRVKIKRSSVRTPEGENRNFEFELEARGFVKASLDAVLGFLDERLKGFASISVRVGRWVTAKVGLTTGKPSDGDPS